MKRSLLEVDYGSDGNDGEEQTRIMTKAEPPKRLKSLPSLPDAAQIPTPKDNPALHQGRVRSQPYVDGQFAAHVYVHVKPNKKLRTALGSVIDFVLEAVPEMHSLIDDTRKDGAELHISLSRPVYLRSRQREPFRAAVNACVKKQAPFQLSFTHVTSFVNDEKSRIFLSIEVGAGHAELKALTDGLKPHLEILRQQTYYAKPRFHFSIAWALLGSVPNGFGVRGLSPQDDLSGVQDADISSRIPGLPDKFEETLESRFSSEIRSCGSFDVEKVHVKIGKQTCSFSLLG